MSPDESANESDTRQPTAQRGRRWIWYSLLGLVVLCCLGYFWLSARNASAKKQVAERLEQLRAQGLPYDTPSLMAYYDQLTSTEELGQWLELLSLVDSSQFSQSVKDLYPWNSSAGPVRGEPWPQQAASRMFLVQWKDLLEGAQRLAMADVKRRLPLTFDGIQTSLEWTEKARKLSRLFELQAVEAIDRRDSKTTGDAIMSLMGCARSVEGQPLIIGQLIAIAIEGTALEHLRQAIESNVLEPEDLQRIKQRLESRTPWQTYWKVGLHGELALMLPAFEQPDRYLADGERPPAILLKWRGRDELTFLQINSQTLELPTADLTEFRDANQLLDMQIQNRLRTNDWVARFDNSISHYLLPAYGAYGEALLQHEMRCRLALLAIGVREYQDRFGKLPDTLEDLKQVGADPAQLKPVGPKPFGFRKLDASVALWGFQSRSANSTPDDPPSQSDPTRPWDRSWLWQIEP